MPRVSCPKCKLSFNQKDTGRKSAECPDCGARFILDGSKPPSRTRQREEAPPPAKKGGGSGLIIAGVLVFLLLGAGAIGGGIYWFVLKKKKDEPLVVEVEPKPEVEKQEEKKEPPKKLKISPSPKLAGNDIYKLLLPATVTIVTSEGSLGSGVLVCRDPNLVVTNRHVVDKFATVRAFFPEFAENGKVIHEAPFYFEQLNKIAIRGRVLERDAQKDVAIVQLDRVPEGAMPVPLAKASANELDQVFGIGASSVKFDSLWQAHEGSVRQVLPANGTVAKIKGLNARLLITQQPTYHGDSGGPIVSETVELVAIVQGAMPPDKGNSTVRQGMAVNVDIEEIRDVINRAWRLNFIGSFPNAAPLHEPGITPTPEGENYTAVEYVQILREGDPTQARTAVDRLVNLGAQSVPPLKDMLEDPKAAGRWPQALMALEKIGEPAVDAMDSAVKTLKSEDANVRIAAVKYLGAMGQPARRHVPSMIQAGRGDNATVRTACEKAIIRLGPFGSADKETILGKNDDKDPAIIGLRARLLVEMELEQEEKVKLMDPFFKHSSPVVRADASRAVCKPGKFPRPDVYRLVIPFLGDSDYSVRSTARDSLYHIGRVEVADLDALQPFFSSDSADVHYYLLQRVRPLGERAAPIVPELSKSLKFANDDVKLEAMQTALGINQNLKILTKDFIAISSHEKPAFRFHAVQCLKLIGKEEPGVLEAMFERLSDGGEVAGQPRSLNELADKSFGTTKDKVRLITDLPPSNPAAPPVWKFTTMLLGDMRPFKSEAQVKEIKSFLKHAEKRSMYAQYYAALCISEAGPAAHVALDDLISTLGDKKVTDHEIRSKLCEGIGNCGREASRGASLLADFATFQIVEDRARAPGDPIRTKNQIVRSAALRALGRLGAGAKDAMPALVKLADPSFDTETQNETIKAFGNIGPAAASAVPNIMELMQKAQPTQRNLIVDTMKKIGPTSLTPIVEFVPKFEKQWREKTGPLKDDLPKARCCVACIIAVGPTNLSASQQAKLQIDLKSLRALCVNRREKELQALSAEALSKLEK